MDLKTAGCGQQQASRLKCVENESILLDNIAHVYGNETRKELQRVSIDYDEQYKFEMHGYASNSKFTQLRQMVFILFINERLVDCQPIRKAINAVYSLYMPKNTNYFVYLNLLMNPKNLDVNIHPTKHEVRFLYQDEIITKIEACFEHQMINSSVSRTYCAKNLTLDTFIETKKLDSSVTCDLNESSAGNTSLKVYPYQLTRMDSKERKLDTYLKSSNKDKSNESLNESRVYKNSYNKEQDTFSSSLRNPDTNSGLTERNINFKSLNELRDKVEKNASKAMHQILQNMNFVGYISQELALIQHQTALYLTNTRRLSEELFYQIGLFNFGQFGYLQFEEPILLVDLALMALDNPLSEWSEEDGSKEKLSNRCAKFLLTKAQLLDDYFSIKITTKLDEISNKQLIYLESIPILLENYEPNLNDWPLFMIRLATEVNWKDEKECFDSICRQLALFYSTKNPLEGMEEPAASSQSTKSNENYVIEHVIYNAFRNVLLVTNEYEKETLFKLVDLSRLYRVFERC